ncbi:MAG: hypothetical protein ACRDNG_04545 [Gaiellaceae bacterium]
MTRVRDPPIAGRRTYPHRRKRRYRCHRCRRTFTEADPESRGPSGPAPRTSSPGGARRARPGACRSMRPITAAATSSRRSSPTSIGVASSRCSTGAAAAP